MNQYRLSSVFLTVKHAPLVDPLLHSSSFRSSSFRSTSHEAETVLFSYDKLDRLKSRS